MTTLKAWYTTIDEYIGLYPQNIQMMLSELRNIILSIAPASEEAIGYGIPTFKLNGINLVHFATFKNHIGFYPTPEPIVAFKKELTQYKQAKGSIQFPLDKSLPIDLIKRIVKFRTEAIEPERK